MKDSFGQNIIIANADARECSDVCALLGSHSYSLTCVGSLEELEQSVHEGDRRIVILDLDSFQIDNRFIKKLRKRTPDICIIAISSRWFHPELKEAISTCVSACLRKPLDSDELLYWLASQYKTLHCSRDSPE